MTLDSSALGVGLGYRQQIAHAIRRNLHEIDFFEVIGDELFDLDELESFRDAIGKSPVVCHFLDLSLATDAPLEERYLADVERVLQAVSPRWFSDHVAITSVPGMRIGHLSPPAFTMETARIVAGKAREIQSRFGLPFLLENIAYPFVLPGAEISEWEFLAEIVELADCGILLDLNNVYVNSCNHGYDPYEYFQGIPVSRIRQVHIAGAVVEAGLVMDSHGHPVSDAVFDYLDYMCRRTEVAGILLERDKNFDDFDGLIREVRMARAIWQASRGAECEGVSLRSQLSTSGST